MSGRGTSGGVAFQAEVGAYIAGLLLAERPLSRLGTGLPGSPKKLRFETTLPVDDILVETDCGEVYIQAKRTITLSAGPEGELASVASQFVKQFRAGAAEGSVRRDLQPARDRLVLAVGHGTAATVANNLREGLDRNRTGAATGVPEHLASALQVFTKLVEDAWLKEATSPITPTDKQAILALCSVTVITDAHRQVVEEALRDVVAVAGDETALIDLLKTWATDASQSGVGGDAAVIRLALRGKVRMVEPPSFKSDVSRLTAYSAWILRRLERFTQVTTPEGNITISRPVVDHIVQAASDGSLAIIGEPGAGKSAIIHRVSQELSKESTVVTLTVEAGLTTLDALRREIGLEHLFTDVLSQMSHDKPAYLVLDALDAVRGGLAEATYKRLVEEVALISGWRIIASIRTFDLRVGKEWHRLFVGTPPLPEHSDKNFPRVRHVHIGLLNEYEKADIASKSPSLSAALLAGGPKMEALARNPFNLALLGDLLKGGIPASSLASVATRGELLERYWEERIAKFGTPATVSLKSVVMLMITARSIDIPETEITIPAASTVDDLQKEGVLVKETTRRIGFRHHVLFDYAVARLILMPDRKIALSHLNKDSGAGLLISPSIGYWLEDLKNNLTPPEFWLFIASLLSSEAADPIVRVEVARLAVESVQPGEDLSPLVDIVNRNDAAVNGSFTNLVGAILTKDSLDQPFEIEPWAHLLAKMNSPGIGQLGSMQALIGALLNKNNSPEAMAALGIASRVLFDVMSSSEKLIAWLSPLVTRYVARTYGTDPAASRKRLDELFVPERFNRFGYVEIPRLAKEVLQVAEYDPELTVQLFNCVFKGANFSSGQITSMSTSWILPLASNAAQDFRLAEHTLVKTYPDLIRKFPRVGVRALAGALRGLREKKYPPKAGHQLDNLPLGDSQRVFDDDGSAAWAWDIDDGSHKEYARLYRTFIQWVQDVDEQPLLEEIPELILNETGIALAWRTLFEAGAKKPEVLGKVLWRSAADAVALNSINTRQSAITVIAATYPHLSYSNRKKAEYKWLQRDFSSLKNSEGARISILGTLFEYIGEVQLVTPEARAFLKAAKSDGTTFINEKPIKIHSGRSAGIYPLAYGDTHAESKAASPLLTLSNTVKLAGDALKEQASQERGTDLWNAVLTLDKSIVEKGIDVSIDIEVLDTLAEGLGIVISQGYIPPDARPRAVERLLELTHHSDPEPAEETEEEFARLATWNSPAPRIQAARALSSVVTVTELWPQIRERFANMLFNDPHPAVRLQLVIAIPEVSAVDLNAMWKLIDGFVAKEKNASVIQYGADALSGLSGRYAERLEPLVLRLYKRASIAEHSANSITRLITFFAINKNFAASRALLKSWIEEYVSEEERLQYVISNIRGLITIGFDSRDQVKEEIRKRSAEFIWALISKVEPAVKSWPLSGEEPSSQEKAALKLFDAIADQIYHAVGHDMLTPRLAAHDSKRQFLSEYKSLISKLATLGTPATVHHLLEILSKLIEANPELCFDLFSEALLRTTGVARYEHESMGAALFVQLVSLYLADYRAIFSDETRRRKLIECMALFVDAGWPEARQLFQSLPELLQ